MNCAFGQDTAIRKIDSTKHNQSFRIRDPATILNDEPLIIIDNKPKNKSSSKRILEKINPNDILEFSVLKDAAAEAIYGSQGANGVIIITTKQYAVSQYQRKLSLFSKKYKNYLLKIQNDDKELIYILNGMPVERKNNDGAISILYKLLREDIKTVRYADNFTEGMKNRATIFITTKQ
jgi:TonB-dependent SusC/RagA subfamily outer membrane receptor